jgi:thioesterase domain-containing protein/acyl carrier protein
MIEHRNVVNLFIGMDGCIQHDPESTWLAVTSLSFDISVIEIFWTLVRGLKVVIYPGDDRSALSAMNNKQDPGKPLDLGINETPSSDNMKHPNAHQKVAGGDHGIEHEPLSIPQMIQLHKVTHFQCTPSMASMLMLDKEATDAFAQLKSFLIGGEAFPATLAVQLQKAVTGDIINMYGPTETTVWSTKYKLNNDQENISIGRPITNTTIHILDEYLQPLPVGVPGELLIGGAGVVRGYHNRPELTAARFIKDPFSDNHESRLYRTGDLARFLPDGNIEFLGRMDYQVKIRGYRIELGEIEAVLNDHPTVHESVVIAREDVSGHKRLVAYVIKGKGASATADELRDHAKKKLPDYMVPAYVVMLKEFPQTPNKKIDRKALPPPGEDGIDRSSSVDPPLTEIEEAIAEIWAEALGVQQVGRNENFFELGGDSISACGIFVNIQQTCQVDLPLQTIIRSPTVAGLAERLEEAFLRQAQSGYSVQTSSGALRPAQTNSFSAETLRRREEDGFKSVCSPTEKALAAIWSKVLRCDRIGLNDNFFHLGGKSIDAVDLFARIEEVFSKRLPLSTLLQKPTIAQLAEIIDGDTHEAYWSPLVPIQPTGYKYPFFCVHAHRGNVLNYYELARYLGPEQPFYGLQARGLDGKNIRFRTFTDMAVDYLNEIRTVQPEGPYLIGGWCMGGYIALEMAQILKAQGEEVALLALIQTAHPNYFTLLPRTTIFHRLIYGLFERMDYELMVLRALKRRDKLPHLWRKAKTLLTTIQVSAERLIEVPCRKLKVKIPHSESYRLHRLYKMNDKAFKAYNPQRYQGRVTVFKATKQKHRIHPDSLLGWGGILNGELELREIPGHYIGLLVEPSIRFLAEELKDCLECLNRID